MPTLTIGDIGLVESTTMFVPPTTDVRPTPEPAPHTTGSPGPLDCSCCPAAPGLPNESRTSYASLTVDKKELSAINVETCRLDMLIVDPSYTISDLLEAFSNRTLGLFPAFPVIVTFASPPFSVAEPRPSGGSEITRPSERTSPVKFVVLNPAIKDWALSFTADVETSVALATLTELPPLIANVFPVRESV